MTRGFLLAPEEFPIRGDFRIARGGKAVARVVVAELREGACRGRGECVPYGRYGETVEGVLAQLEMLRTAVEAGLERSALQDALPPGAARNALDCALWDLEAKRSGQPAWALAGLPQPVPRTTLFTISLAAPEAMAKAARQASDRPLLKVKLGAAGDPERLQAVRQAAPQAGLVVDANEGWSPAQLVDYGPLLVEAGVLLVEQPLPAGQDEALRGLGYPVPLGADESFHGLADIERLAGLYQLVNLKLDKTGGLTEALRVRERALAAGFGIMVGCMVGSSLSMAPATLLTDGAAFVDLDGPLLLTADRSPGLRYDGAVLHPSTGEVWG